MSFVCDRAVQVLSPPTPGIHSAAGDSGLSLGTLLSQRGVAESQQPRQRRSGCAGLVSGNNERPGAGANVRKAKSP